MAQKPNTSYAAAAAVQAAAVAKRELLNRVLPDCYIYISHLDEGHQFWRLPGYPDEISDKMNSTFAENSALGRSAPVFTFSNTGPRTISVSINFHRDMFDEINQASGAKYENCDDMAESFVHALQAIAVPKYNLSNKAIEPPLVAIRFGQEVFIKGIVSGGVTVTYGKPILVNEKYATMKIDFSITEVDPYDSTTVFKNGSFRGMVQTLRSGMNF